MALIVCPECQNRISEYATSCPHCGLPAERFYRDEAVGATNTNDIDFVKLKNALNIFKRDYSTLLKFPGYISGKRLKKFKQKYNYWFSKVSSITNYRLIETQAAANAINMTEVEEFLRRYLSFNSDMEAHNRDFIDRSLISYKDYFDKALKSVDPNLLLDEEQRRAILTDDDYCLLVAGAGSGKTTTITGKVKYLVEIQGIDPSDIIVISYTNKAVNELKHRIQKLLKLPIKVSTFHAFAYDLILKFDSTCPKVNYSAYNIIAHMLEKEIFNDQAFLRKVLLFLGYYFEIPEDVMEYESLNQYHLLKAQKDYETLKSNAGEYIKKVADQRKMALRTLTGEFLRSVQETQIANFLYLNAIDYEYEPVYPYRISSARKKYTPDFLIRQGELKVYLEHYAINENFSSYVFNETELKRYANKIASKRRIHKENGSLLLETWSGYNDRGQLVDHLAKTLKAAGFVLKERDFSEVYKKIVETSKDKYIVHMTFFLMEFISLYKTCGYDDQDFTLLRSKTDNPRTLLFLDIAETVYHYYQSQLKSKRSIDFEDMINNANTYLTDSSLQKLDLPYKYIIVDEFQDIARQRFNLTKKLSETTQAKVLAVGDDWQSIFAFAGSEVNLFTQFLEMMGGGIQMQITHTYRNSQELIDIAGGFIQKNTKQIPKKLISPKRLNNPLILIEYDDSYKANYAMADAAEKAVGMIVKEHGSRSPILFLGRYNFDSFKLCQSGKFAQLTKEQLRCLKYPDAPIISLTTHSAKGLGFENVVLINITDKTFGFPCQLEDDPIMHLVRKQDDSLPFAEERRLFYVALTRTKNRAYILTPQNKPSRFLIELIEDYQLPHSDKLRMEIVDTFKLRCPLCNYPLKAEFNKNYGLNLYLCTNEPEICDFMTNSKNYLHDIYKCDKCQDGYMIVKTSDDNVFYGCTNYDSKNKSGCKNTKAIKRKEAI